MNKLLIALILSLAPAAFAETISCSFTEPFFSLSYDTHTQVLKKTEPNMTGSGETTTVVARNVSVIRRSNLNAGVLASFSRYSLVDRHGHTLLRLTLNYQGSDGMSDITFPYEAVIPNSTSSANNGVGGCESGSLKSINPDDHP